MASMDLPVRAIREQISSAVDLIVQQSRMRDGSRKIVQISEVQGLEGERIVLQDLFVYAHGQASPTGVRPKFEPRLDEAGVSLPPAIFGQ
jgi:pilus assembly protein CpaF